MKIKYKFNKSSEARDCVVKDVELKIEKYTPYKKLTLQLFKEVLDNCKKAEDDFIADKITGEGVCKQIESTYKSEIKQFTSPQQLKDYINTIDELIEFIAKSSIDDVLMKEWIGEWEYKELDCNWTNLMYGGKTIKTGSPKLNSNWTFKIE